MDLPWAEPLGQVIRNETLPALRHETCRSVGGRSPSDDLKSHQGVRLLIPTPRELESADAL